MCPPTYFSSSTIIPRIAQARLILSRLIEEEEDLSSNSFHFFGRPVVETLKSHLHEPECFVRLIFQLNFYLSFFPFFPPFSPFFPFFFPFYVYSILKC